MTFLKGKGGRVKKEQCNSVHNYITGSSTLTSSASPGDSPPKSSSPWWSVGSGNAWLVSPLGQNLDLSASEKGVVEGHSGVHAVLVCELHVGETLGATVELVAKDSHPLNGATSGRVARKENHQTTERSKTFP